jgi:uncharacterized membrane protein
MNSNAEKPGMDDVFTDEVKVRIELAIKSAESNTSAELRVHIEDDCPEDPLDRATFIFAQLSMHKTKLRNGVLIYLALGARKLAIIGDVGINIKMPANAWDDIYASMSEFFKKDQYEEGIIHGVELVGKAIKIFFPIEVNDKNELSNQVTTGNKLKP